MKKTLGTFFEMGGRGAMEALSRAGLDYVIIDTEHGPFSEETAADLIAVAERGGLAPYVRIGDIRRPYVLRMADVGARGLIVPNIRTPGEVRELVGWAKFPPEGNRGYCPTRVTGWGADEWGRDVAAYMAESNRRCKVIPQCETAEALGGIEEIAAIDGVDGVFVGPCDLSIALGIPLRFDHPLLTDAAERILAACRAHGKESYIFASSPEDALKWAKMGYDSVAYSLDARVLTDAFRVVSDSFRAGVGETL